MKRLIATTFIAATAAFGASAQYYGAGSTMNQTPGAPYQRMQEQQRVQQAEAQRRNYENLMEMNRRAQQQYIEAERQRNLQSNYYRKYPTESPTYRFVERAAPWVDRTSNCVQGIFDGFPPVRAVQMIRPCVFGVANIPN